MIVQEGYSQAGEDEIVGFGIVEPVRSGESQDALVPYFVPVQSEIARKFLKIVDDAEWVGVARLTDSVKGVNGTGDVYYVSYSDLDKIKAKLSLKDRLVETRSVMADFPATKLRLLVNLHSF